MINFTCGLQKGTSGQEWKIFLQHLNKDFFAVNFCCDKNFLLQSFKYAENVKNVGGEKYFILQ